MRRSFIVSKFNSDIEKRIQEAISTNPELSTIKDISFYDYPKGEINFIILNDGTTYYYIEEYIWNWCGWGSDKIKPLKRERAQDSLHKIKFNQIYSILKERTLKVDWINQNNNPHHISFSFENDTIKIFDIYKLLQDIDSLGYHSYNIRRTAPFKENLLKIK